MIKSASDSRLHGRAASCGVRNRSRPESAYGTVPTARMVFDAAVAWNPRTSLMRPGQKTAELHATRRRSPAAGTHSLRPVAVADLGIGTGRPAFLGCTASSVI